MTPLFRKLDFSTGDIFITEYLDCRIELQPNLRSLRIFQYFYTEEWLYDRGSWSVVNGKNPISSSWTAGQHTDLIRAIDNLANSEAARQQSEVHDAMDSRPPSCRESLYVELGAKSVLADIRDLSSGAKCLLADMLHGSGDHNMLNQSDFDSSPFWDELREANLVNTWEDDSGNRYCNIGRQQ